MTSFSIGDESYHADCFRCRSCSNKIEELIFAKTNQGIWCMNCHNERVARTRKHAEQKRNRQARKDKDGVPISGTLSSSRSGGGRSRSEREHRERDRDREKRADGGDASMDVPDVPQGPTPSASAQDILSASSATSSSIPPRPLPPSPIPGPYPRNPSLDNNSDAHRRAQTSPGEAPRATPPYHLPPSTSAYSINTSLSAASPPVRSTSPLYAPALVSHDRAPSQASQEGFGSDRRTSASQLRQEINAGSSRRPSQESSRGAEQLDFQPYALPSSPSVSSFRQVDGSPEILRQHQPPLSPTSEAAAIAANGSRSNSLSAPSGGGAVDKSANRRSGFYGLGRPSVGEQGERSTSPLPPPSPPPQGRSSTTPPVNSYLPDLHQSVSFYDPDTLLFLNHVGSAPSSPKLGKPPLGMNKALPDLTFSVDDQSIERLSPSPGPADVSGDEEEEYGNGASGDGAVNVGIPGGRRNDIARKVRESIHVAKRESEGGAQPPGALDVELVEMLLKELEETKREMKEIKGKYNAFRVRLPFPSPLPYCTIES